MKDNVGNSFQGWFHLHFTPDFFFFLLKGVLQNVACLLSRYKEQGFYLFVCTIWVLHYHDTGWMSRFCVGASK